MPFAVASAAEPVATDENRIAADEDQTVDEPKKQQHHNQDRLVKYLITLVTYPFTYLLIHQAAELEGLNALGASETRKKLDDFPEGLALVNLEK